jgi:hypothetical protein
MIQVGIFSNWLSGFMRRFFKKFTDDRLKKNLNATGLETRKGDG